MSTINQAIISRVEAFVRDLNELLREAAVASIHDALENHGIKGGRQARLPRGRNSGAPAEGEDDSAGGRVKRTAEQLDRISTRILSYVESHPGEGVEEISKGLSVTSKELTLPMRKLLADGKVSTTGQKRATKYSAGRPKAGRRRASK